jgi:hypothetical protein
MRLYALVSDESEAVIDWYPSREAAYTALRECLADDPDWDECSSSGPSTSTSA